MNFACIEYIPHQARTAVRCGTPLASSGGSLRD